MRTLRIILALILGAGVGLAVGMLTAPRSGKRTRDRMLKDFTVKKAELEKMATSRLNEAKEILNESMKKQADVGRDAIDKVKKVVTV